MNEMPGIPMIRQQEDIPFGERLTLAIQKFFLALANCLMCLFLAPIIFGRTLFTTKRDIWVPASFLRGLPGPQGPLRMDINLTGQEDENWKKDHDDIFGTDEEGSPHN